MLQTPIITANKMTVVRLGFRQIFRQPNWKYMKKFLIASLNLGIANLGIEFGSFPYP
jgi:hypothetical protein